MITFAVDYLERLETLHTDIEKSISGLPAEALDWKPGPDMNSIAVLITHLTGSERYWIGDVANQDPSNRVREAEFLVRGLSAEDLTQRLRDTLDYARKALALMTLADFDTLRQASMRKGDTTAGWALLHALEHTAIHVGHVQLMSDLWRQGAAGA